MLKSIHNILLVTLRDIITYKMCLNINLQNSGQPSVQYTFVLGSESSLPGEEPAGLCQRRLPQWQTDRCLLSPAWSSPAAACPPVPYICLTLTGMFSFYVVVCSCSLTLCLWPFYIYINLHMLSWMLLQKQERVFFYWVHEEFWYNADSP